MSGALVVAPGLLEAAREGEHAAIESLLAICQPNIRRYAQRSCSISAVDDPGSTLAVVASIVPFSSSLAMPVRIATGSATPVQIVLALIVLLGSTAALIPLAGRLYACAVLQTSGRVKLRDGVRVKQHFAGRRHQALGNALVGRGLHLRPDSGVEVVIHQVGDVAELRVFEQQPLGLYRAR